MGFVMDGLAAEAYDRSYSDRQLLARILAYFKPVGRTMAVVALMVVLNSLMDTVLPIMISRGVDALGALAPSEAARGAAGAPLLRDPAQQRGIGLIVAAILVSGVASWSFNFLRQWLTARTVGDVVLELRRDAFDAVMARDMSFYDENPSGKIVSRVTSDTQDFANVVTLTLNLLSQALLVLLIIMLLVYVIFSFIDRYGRHPISAFLSLILAPLLRPIRSRLPPLGPLDLSVFVLSILLIFIRFLIVGTLQEMA